MREIRLSGSEGGVALIAPSLPLSQVNRSVTAKGRSKSAGASACFTH